MTDGQIALARRAVACRSWRLMRGMRFLLSDGGTTLITHETNPNGWVSATRGFYSRRSWAALDALPDLSDPATLGCLFALVRKRWGPNVTMAYQFTNDGSDRWVWIVQSAPRDYVTPDVNPPSVWLSASLAEGATEEEALVAALEAAP